jgi:NAD(P)-dependent dehydrogenase (short-subunit alcohol dehydrogenase family)
MTTPRIETGLAGKVALVTGASSGIGAGIAQALAQAGADLIVTGRDAQRLAKTGASVRAAGRRCVEVAADLADADAAARVADAAVAAYGRVDTLVNNAGVFELRPFREAPVEELDRQYAVNVRAPYALTRALVPSMPRGSTVVFVSSNLARGIQPGAAPYAATKAAVEQLARTIAVELAPDGIRVNVLAPGMTHTPMTGRLSEDPEAERAAVSQTPAGRLGAVEDIAAAAVYLASDASRYVLGAVLTIDGGWSLQGA